MPTGEGDTSLPQPHPHSFPSPPPDRWGYTGDRCQGESSERNWKEVRDRRAEDPGPAQVGGWRVGVAAPVGTDTL